MKSISKILILFVISVMSIFIAAGCDDTSTDPTTTYVDNPNVESYDSIGVDEDSAAFISRTGINLLNGLNTVDTARLRDVSLNDQNNNGLEFYLQNGEQLKSLLPPGYETRFFRVSEDMSVTTFDTLSKVPNYTSFTPNDFTQSGTEFWGYFTAPLATYPVYCFWLKGKKEAGITQSNVYGIIQPREATDRDPNQVYGFRMSFRVRINTNGENDFREQILQVE
jgi:ABC-type oligopeptide transport system substrate-binding subunit